MSHSDEAEATASPSTAVGIRDTPPGIPDLSGATSATPATAKLPDTTDELELTENPKSRSARTLFQTAWLRIRSSKVALVSAGFLVLLVLFAVFAPFLSSLSGNDPTTTHTGAEYLDPNVVPGLPLPHYRFPSADHWLGIEPGLGRDLFSRLAYGARVSLVIALLATLCTVVIGTVLGALAGFLGGIVDYVLGRVMDLMLAFPHLLLVLSLTPILQSRLQDTALGQGSILPIASLVIILSLFGWPYLARVVRGQVIAIREQEYVLAAKSYGASTWNIVIKEVVPNTSGIILVYSTLLIPQYISAEAALSFLGVGVKDPTSSWGQMLNAAQAGNWYLYDPWYLVVPGLTIVLTVLAFNLFGDALRDALDPKAKK